MAGNIYWVYNYFRNHNCLLRLSALELEMTNYTLDNTCDKLPLFMIENYNFENRKYS